MTNDNGCVEELTAALTSFAAAGNEMGSYADQVVSGDRPKFSELVDPNPEKNLFARSPLSAMGAAQRVLAIVRSQGSEKRKIAFLPEPITVYPFLTDGTPVTQGYRLEGSWKAAAEIVSFVKAQAFGDRSGRIVPVAFGPGGTGKSESRTVIEKGAEYLTTYNPDYFIYSYDFINMNELPEMVKRFGPGVDVIPAPRGKSPITLLPPALQQQALRMAAIKGSAMLEGQMPSIGLTPDKWTRTILSYIIDQATSLKGSPLTMAETVQAIAHHTRIRRTVMSSAYRQFPIINVQGIDADASSLFVSSMPLVFSTSPEGKMDPFAYSYSGLMFQGDGNFTVMEEALRSDPKFLEKIMDGLESREFQFAGAAKEPWDSFLLWITNKESYDLLMAKPGLKALKQRMQLIEMVQPTQPQLVARTILYGFKDNLLMKKIGVDGAQWEMGNLDVLYPIPEKLEPGHIVGPERRYLMKIGGVEISPHTLRFMAQIVAATRIETDKEKAYPLVPTRLVHDDLFTNPIQRIRYWDGKLTDIQPEERRTLDELTDKLHEGHNGIVHRNILGWMRKCLEAVRNDPRLGNTLTPATVFKVFLQEGFRTDGFIQTADHGQSEQFKALAKLVLKELLVPAIREDINLAYSAEGGNLSEVYQDVLDELYTDGKSPNATEYESTRTNTIQGINRARVNFIKNHYKSQHGREIPMAQILFFHMNQLRNGNKAPEPSPEITAALSAFMATKILEAANATGLNEAIRNGTGSKETLDLVNSLVKHMEKLGYNHVAAMAAFDTEHMANQASETVGK